MGGPCNNVPFSSDSPVKCNTYWPGGMGPGGRLTGSRHMFCCRVLLGEIKVSAGILESYGPLFSYCETV